MKTHRLRPSPPRVWSWMLWLALLVPVAQAMAMSHAVSHVREAANGGDDERKGAPQSGSCSICLSAAALSGVGATMADARAFVAPALRHAEPVAPSVDGGVAAPLHAYLSRAPPSALD